MATINYDGKSSTLLNAIKNSASDSYQARVPDATQDNLAQVGSAILDYESTRNEFLSALIDRIGKVLIKNKLYENPLKEFKGDKMTYGKDIEEVYVDLCKAQVYDPETASNELYKRVLPDVKTVFHTLNRQEFYKQTIEESDLELAFLNENGVSMLVDKIFSAMYTSDEYDEFLMMKNLINVYGVEGKFAIETVNPVSDEQTAKTALSAIKSVSNKLTFLSTDYNYAGVHTYTDKKDQIVLIDADFDAIVDVEVLASAFNMSKADFIGRRKLIDNFGGLSNVLCAIVDREWFMVYDKLIRTEEERNKQGLYYNVFLHHWQVLSVSPFANAVLFVTQEPVLDSITLTPSTATVPKGTTAQFVPSATSSVGNAPSKVTYTLTGATSDNTFISTVGLLYVASDETATEITVTATSTYDETITATATVTVI